MVLVNRDLLKMLRKLECHRNFKEGKLTHTGGGGGRFINGWVGGINEVAPLEKDCIEVRLYIVGIFFERKEGTEKGGIYFEIGE